MSSKRCGKSTNVTAFD